MATRQTNQVQHDRIERRPGVCGGSPCIKGTRMPVWSIVNYWKRGLSESELETYFSSQLDAVDIQAALAYYHDHKEEIEQEIRENEEA